MQGVRKLPHIEPSEMPSVVSELMDYIRWQGDELQWLRDEIARLKGLKEKPKIEPSGLAKSTDGKKSSDELRPGSAKRSKTEALRIDEEIIVRPKNVFENLRSLRRI